MRVKMKMPRFNQSFQTDLREQLVAVGQIIKKAQESAPFPLLDAINFKIEKYINAVSNIILSDDEFAINKFLKTEVSALFNHLQNTTPALKQDIELYFANVDPDVN